MPTFMIFKNGRETQRIKGADPQALNAAVKSLAAEASSSDTGAEGSGSGGSGGTWMGTELPRGYSDITSSVDQQGLDFLNLDSSAGGARSVFESSEPSALSKGKGKSTGSASTGNKKDYIESDTDEQIMMFIPFQSSLKIHSLHLTSVVATQEGDEDETEEVMRPRTVNIYISRSNVLGFDEAEDLPPTQSITLEPGDWDTKTHTAKLELRFVKFQNVSSLVVFVVDGIGDGEKTRVDRVRILGETGEARKMGKLEKIGDEQGE